MQWRGSFVPLITPFDRKLRIDRKALEKLVEWHIAEGTDGIVCSATTGEGPVLSDADRKTVAEICVKTAARRIPIIVATGINDTRQSIKHTEKAQSIGADGCLVVTPYYNRPTQRGCFLHFEAIAKVGLPVIVYHNPPRTAIRLLAETVIEMAQIPNIVAIKESSHDLDLVRKIQPFLPVFSGDDDMTLSTLREGGVGSISVTANLFPRSWKQMIDCCLERRWERGNLLFERFSPVFQALFLETNPQCVKFALSWMGRCQPFLRLPLILPNPSTQMKIKRSILQYVLYFMKSLKSPPV